MRICFLIRSLHYGGAERQLVELARGLKGRGHMVTVLSFYSEGPLGEDLRAAGIDWSPLGKGGRWDMLPFLLRLVRRVRALRPDVLHSYATVPNVVAAVAAPFLGPVAVVWGVRASALPRTEYDVMVHASLWLSAWLARWADLIIVNSSAGAEDHVSLGYPESRMVVIPNGIDTDRFRPDAERRSRTRAAWELSAEEIVVGNVARLDPMKDAATFLRAAALVFQKRPECRFVCVGSAGDEPLAELRRLATELGLGRSFRWLPATHDPADVYRALDVHCSSSAFGEGFSNALGEALATGIPCVATNVGDAGRMLHGLGLVVPPGDSEALADAMLEMLDRRSAALTDRCRRRIVEEFSVPQLIERTESTLASLLD